MTHPSTSTVFEIDESNAAEWLRGRFGLDAGRVEVLPGGVSNTVLLVEVGARRLVLKQSLGQLRVKEVWLCDRARILRESSAMIVRMYLQRGVISIPSSVSTAWCQATLFAIGEM